MQFPLATFHSCNFSPAPDLCTGLFWFCARAQDRSVVLCARTNTCGLPSVFLGRLFVRFMQARFWLAQAILAVGDYEIIEAFRPAETVLFD